MWSLTSSAALVLNVFGHWRVSGNSPLVAALGFDAGAAELRFEESLPTGLEGDPPTADVSGRCVMFLASVEGRRAEFQPVIDKSEQT